MDVRVLAERLMTYDTSGPDGLRAGAAFVKGWLEARDIEVAEREFDGLPVVLARVGPRGRAAQVLFHGHLDVVPAREGQFSPRVEGDRLIGRGAYDMKGALAALMLRAGRRQGPAGGAASGSCACPTRSPTT